MSTPIIHSDILETEGTFREEYAAWMAEMADTTIESRSTIVVEVESEDLPF